jgi:hypothetical protein
VFGARIQLTSSATLVEFRFVYHLQMMSHSDMSGHTQIRQRNMSVLASRTAVDLKAGTV